VKESSNACHAVSTTIKTVYGHRLRYRDAAAIFSDPRIRRGGLVQAVPNYRSRDMTLYAMYPSRRYLDDKIRTSTEFLRGEIS